MAHIIDLARYGNFQFLLTRPATKKTPDPLLIQFQQEDGSILPADQLDQEVVASTIRDTAASLPVGKANEPRCEKSGLLSFRPGST